MRRYLLSVVLFLSITVTAFSQTNFTLSPQHPKAGDVITITYEPAGAIAGTMNPVEAVAYFNGSKPDADDIALKREGKKYTSTIKTDTSQNFIYLGFSADNKWDNNFNEGYYILLNDNQGKVKKGAYNNLAMFYQYMGSQVGVERNNEKAIASLEKEMELYPEDRKKWLPQYLRLIGNVKKDQAPALIQKEIEGLLKEGLKTEEDYAAVEALYEVAKLPEQKKWIANIRKEKYPNGKWQINETIQAFYREQDPVKAEAMLTDIMQKIETAPDWKHLQPHKDNYKTQIPFVYMRKKDWEGLKTYLVKNPVKDPTELANMYNEIAWELQKTSSDLKFAEEISRQATESAKKQMANPTAKKPPYFTPRQWEKNRKFTYAQYADTYAMVLYRMGQYKKGFPYIQDALKIGERKNTNHNNTYALLAEKVLPARQYKKEMEEFVKNGKATAEMTEGLKRLYLKEKGSETGFDDYITALKKESYLKMVEELRKSMLNETAPTFALMDLDGNKVSLTDLKGKVVVVDFWATWCGPCKASFPGMQKMVTKYKENPDVKFIFIDTWEQGEDKKKAVADFITSNKYSFQVLMDEDNKVIEQYKVEGIPTKFVIDKAGTIRFKSVGFDGSDDKLMSELTAMIDLAANGPAKTF